jgi:RND family efflux transporter MFP subunit
MTRKIRVALLLTILIAGLGVAGGAVAWKLSTEVEEESAQRPERPVAVEVRPVSTGSIRDIRRLSGSLAPAAEYVVAPKISGRLRHLTVDIGDEVERGQVIAQLEDDEQREALTETMSELEVSRARLDEADSAVEIARRRYERVENLFKDRVASDSDVDDARLELLAREAERKVTEAQLRQREAAARTSEIRLSYATIAAEWEEGVRRMVVGQRYVDEGALLSTNDAIVSLLDIDRLRAVAFVTERDYTRLSIGQTALVSVEAYSNRQFEGRITRLAPQFSETSRQARLEVEIDNSSRDLKPGMFVRLDVKLEERDNARLVPMNALTRREGVQGLFVVDRETGTARFVQVTVGIIEGGVAEIVEPANLAGEVVTLGQNLLSDGSAITIPEPRAALVARDGETPTAITAGG